jgi:hypothetical protein
MPVLSFAHWLRASMANASGPHAKPKTQQIYELAQLALRQLFLPEEYYLYRFYERDKDYKYMLRFLCTRHQRNQLQHALNNSSWKVILDNKWMFHLHYSAVGVPVTKVFGYYSPIGGFTARGAPLRSDQDLRTLLEQVRPSSLVIKPIGGIQGKGLLILKKLNVTDSDILGTTIDGRSLSFPQIAEHLSRDHGVRYSHHHGHEVYIGGYILEEHIQQHPFLAEINPHTTNTLRLVTFAHESGAVEVDFAVARFGRKGQMADNWDAGGISVHVDPKTGVLGRGVLKPKHGGAWLERHPDTHVVFEGRQIPQWEHVRAGCEAAARVLPEVRSVGWDVILTNSGPRIIEGNPDWDPWMVQVHTHGYLEPPIRARFERFGLTFPEERLPAPNLFRVARDLMNTNTVKTINPFRRRRLQ